MIRRCLLLLTLMAVPAISPAQARPDDGLAGRARAALAPLAGLVGKWEGDARIVTGPGGQQVVRQYEDVVFGAGSTVVMIRGTGRATEAAERGTILFEAAAMLWFDPDSNRIRVRAHRAEGTSVETQADSKTDTLIWGFGMPGGRVRYTIAFTKDEWHEVGHFLREGAPPVQVIEMRLKRGG